MAHEFLSHPLPDLTLDHSSPHSPHQPVGLLHASVTGLDPLTAQHLLPSPWSALVPCGLPQLSPPGRAMSHPPPIPTRLPGFIFLQTSSLPHIMGSLFLVIYSLWISVTGGQLHVHCCVSSTWNRLGPRQVAGSLVGLVRGENRRGPSCCLLPAGGVEKAAVPSAVAACLPEAGQL